jgi:hypothetical protein
MAKSSLERVSIRTKHFAATLNIPNRTWELAGSFPHEVRVVADDPWNNDVLRPEIEELYDLEATIRSMFDVKKPEVEDGVQLHPVSEG